MTYVDCGIEDLWILQSRRVSRVPLGAVEMAFRPPLVLYTHDEDRGYTRTCSEARLWRHRDRWFISDWKLDTWDDSATAGEPTMVKPKRSLLDWLLRRPWPPTPKGHQP